MPIKGANLAIPLSPPASSQSRQILLEFATEPRKLPGAAVRVDDESLAE